MMTIETVWTEALLVEDFTAAFCAAIVGAQLLGGDARSRPDPPASMLLPLLGRVAH